MAEILGEEADYAACETCGLADLVDSGVCCEACGGWFHRRLCWENHWCGVLTDRNGRAVRIGDTLRYYDAPHRIFTIVEALPSYIRIGMCRAERSNGEILSIRPRLMELF